MLSGMAVVSIVVIAVAVAISGGAPKHGLAQGDQARRLYAQVNDLLAGIPEHGTVLGRKDAKVSLTFFGDLECPVCAAFATGAKLDGVAGGLPQFVRDQIRPGHAKVVYRSFCTATCDAFSNGQNLFDEQQSAAYAAGRQNRFWYYEELFDRQQGSEGSPYVTNGFLARLAQQIPSLRLGAWTNDRRNRTVLSQLQADELAANRQLPLVNGSRGTPGLVMSGPRGTKFVSEGDADYSQLQAALRAVA